MSEIYIWTGSCWERTTHLTLQQAQEESTRQWGPLARAVTRDQYLQMTETFDSGDAGDFSTGRAGRSSRQQK